MKKIDLRGSSFYFEFGFDADVRVGLCYDYGFNSPTEFEICYYDIRNGWDQIRTYLWRPPSDNLLLDSCVVLTSLCPQILQFTTWLLRRQSVNTTIHYLTPASYSLRYVRKYYTSLTVICFPNGFARRAQIQILHIFIIVSHINYLRPLDLVDIGLASSIRASHIVNPRQSGVQFRVAVNNMIESLFAFFQLRT